ncbi:MAG: hypothetical protein K2Q23_01860 [Bryobacteraceae bacterium]|nr:hypothetical protein [Bryobacteraceae bacterium]
MNPRLNWRGPLLLLFVGAASARAQAPAYQPPNLKTVLFGGFSSVQISPGKDLDRVALNGWTASITDYRIFERWGLAAEFGGARRDGAEQTSYLFGGTFRAVQRKRLALTGRILAGATRWEPEAPTAGEFRKQTAFTFSFGQAIDIKLSENLAFRVQPDLRFVRFQEPNGSSGLSLVTPISVGLVYQFGRR